MCILCSKNRPADKKLNLIKLKLWMVNNGIFCKCLTGRGLDYNFHTLIDSYLSRKNTTDTKSYKKFLLGIYFSKTKSHSLGFLLVKYASGSHFLQSCIDRVATGQAKSVFWVNEQKSVFFRLKLAEVSF